jgi:hypothetical protein
MGRSREVEVSEMTIGFQLCPPPSPDSSNLRMSLSMLVGTISGVHRSKRRSSDPPTAVSLQACGSEQRG